jgi:pimeloyl-ACP methyl ester carboxylesterase
VSFTVAAGSAGDVEWGELQLRRVLALLVLVVLCGFCRGDQPAGPEPRLAGRDYVVLLHGLGRTSRSMCRMEQSLAREGYDVVNVDYPSTEKSIDLLVQDLAAIVERRCDDPARALHFVTHSLGGILVRRYLNEGSSRPVARVVMLSPPNRGSELSDKLGDKPLFRSVLGAAGRELGTGEADLPRQLGPVTPAVEVGIICGDRSVNPFFSYLVAGRDDGKVSIESARLEEAKDFLVMHTTHTFMMQRKPVIEQVVRFLAEGSFLHDAERAAPSPPQP